jgi:hypothetical protein
MLCGDFGAIGRCGECDDGEVVLGCFLEACCDASELLEFGEAALDEVALCV